jgi:HSP20 family protein
MTSFMEVNKMMTPFTDAFESLSNLQRSFERAMSNDLFGMSTTNRGVFPGINVFRNKDEYVLIAELPGVRKDELSIEVHGDQIRLSGERRLDHSPKEVSVHRRERDFGRFDRTFRVPYTVDQDQVRAEFQDGILKVRLPQVEREKPRRVAIQ